MSETSPRHIEIAAPAKLNLGLEVIGRREDGFHEIATIFLTIDLQDHLRLSPDADLKLSCDDPELAGADNLALRALRTLREETGYRHGAHIALRKRIPAAAGLGGASSDAAATLLAARKLWPISVSDESLHRIAAGLGSDIPFFLHGGCALGRGRGELLDPLPVPTGIWFVVVAPKIVIPHKTAAMYARLGGEDFSDGQCVAAQANRIATHRPLDPALLGNAFARPLYDLAPQLSRLPGIMRGAGAEVVAISGAGPTHYAMCDDWEEAASVADLLRRQLGNRAQVIVTGPAAERPAVAPSL